MKKLFGTDGIRGIAGEELTPELCLKVGRALGAVLSENCDHTPTVIIGADTRISSEAIVCAISAGLLCCGVNVIDQGIAPTPAIAYLTVKNKADAGIVVSASHNTYKYNGIKIFSGDGFKFPDEGEALIEEIVFGSNDGKGNIKDRLFGKRISGKFGIDDYVGYLKGVDSTPTALNFVIDCANGATVRTAGLFKDLLTNCVFIGDSPNGTNINDECGSTSLRRLKEEVVRLGYDGGLAFDGDGDRVLAVDENGDEIDGDIIMAIIAKRLKMQGRLYKSSVVGTVMTNLGFIKFCESEGINYSQSAVGDRYVLEMMEKEGYSLGGEQSGHIILRDYATTGDGQLTGIFLLGIIKKEGKRLSELKKVMKKYPQSNLTVYADDEKKRAFLSDEKIGKTVDRYKKSNPDARILVRASGTEPLIRIMAEGASSELTERICRELKEEIGKRLEEITS